MIAQHRRLVTHHTIDREARRNVPGLGGRIDKCRVVAQVATGLHKGNGAVKPVERATELAVCGIVALPRQGKNLRQHRTVLAKGACQACVVGARVGKNDIQYLQGCTLRC